MFRKIDLYVDGAYWCSTQRYQTLRKAKESIMKAHYVAGSGKHDGIDAKRITAKYAK